MSLEVFVDFFPTSDKVPCVKKRVKLQLVNPWISPWSISTIDEKARHRLSSLILE